MPFLKIYLLGSPRIEQENRTVDLPRRKAQALLFYLAMTGGPQQRATLATLLWPESDQQRAHGSLRRHLSELNLALGGNWIAADHDTIALARPADLWVDVIEFQHLLASCQHHDHAASAVCPACIQPLTAAVALYRADFLAGFTLPDAPAFDEWQFFQSEGLRQSYATALEQLVQAHLAQAEAEAAIPYARQWLNLDPLHEPAHRQLMHLYVATGQLRAALRQYEVCVQTLHEELDVPPAAATTALYNQIRQGGVNPISSKRRSEPVTARVARHHLPAATTPFIGRVKEMSELTNLCRDATRRLITILGPGGIGKTRLALAVAAQLVDDPAYGIFFVPLAQLSDPAHMIPTIAAALDLQFQADGRSAHQQLFDYLQQKQLLLVLDNFEHLLEGVELVQELLQSCPALCLLVTSRERLQLSGETLFTLGSLHFPTWETPQSSQVYDAVQLFIATAQRVRPHQTLHADEMQYIARICRLVGGMPLGIILAAAWVEVLSPAEIAAELTQGFDWLETELRDLPERQRSMRAVLAYSWQRLTAAEQAVFMQLTLFRGGFTRAAAQTVAGAALPVLARLVDKSFVQRTADARYDIHELLRQYAEQQWQAAGAYATAQAAHGAYYLHFLQQCAVGMAGAEQLPIILQLEADFENIRAAWQWAVQTRNYGLVDAALDGLFRWFWLRRSRQQEGLALLYLAHQQWTPATGQTAPPVWGRILARMMEQQGPWLVAPTMVRERVAQALALAQQQANHAEITFCRWVLGLVIVSENRMAERKKDLRLALYPYEQCIDAWRASEDQFWLGQALENLGHTYRLLNQCDRAIPPLQESLALRRTQADLFGCARSLREIAWVRFIQGLEHGTLDAAQAAYALQSELGDQQGMADSRFFLALCSLCCGDWLHAKELLHLARHFAEETNNALYRRWTARALSMATCMEADVRHRQSDFCSFPNHFTAFTTRVCHVLFSIDTPAVYLVNVQELLRLAATELEIAVCLLFRADLLARAGEHPRAVKLLALAFRYPAVAEGWLGHLPELVAMQQDLRNHLPPADFAAAWAQGQALDLQATAAELPALLARAHESLHMPNE